MKLNVVLSFLLGFGMAMVFRHFTSLPFWAEALIVLGIALVFYLVDKKAKQNLFNNNTETKD